MLSVRKYVWNFWLETILTYSHSMKKKDDEKKRYSKLHVNSVECANN